MHLIQRSTILLSFGEGRTPSEIAREMDTERNTAAKWRARWIAAKPELDRIKQENALPLRSAIKATLQDAARPGKPTKFTTEQVAHIIKTACEKPEHFGIPLSHWTPSALAREVVKQQIVPSISSRQVGRFLKREGFETASKPVLAESEHHG
ncbi:helix-turn-helix domain-containing protein [Paenibacillus dendritiformis]|uniref:helix-turn-helix domain-containing protein n=1 Tax=Paenibacillus dendritiformis TaxID=130049 RepID=UPI00387E02B7